MPGSYALQQKRSAGDISNFYQHVTIFCFSLLEPVSDLSEASNLSMQTIAKANPTNTHHCSLYNASILCIYTIWKHHILSLQRLSIMSIYYVDDTCEYRIYNYSTLGGQAHVTYQRNPTRKQTKTLLFPHGKGKGCKGYGTTPRPLNHNKRTMTAPHLRSGSPAWDNNSPGALAEHQALDRTSSSQATDETQTASHRHPHESRFCSLVARITLRGIQLQSCIWYQMNTAGYWRFAGQKAQCWESQCKGTNIKLDISQSFFAYVFLARLAFEDMPFQWIPSLLQIFSGGPKVIDNHMTKKIHGKSEVCAMKMGDSHAQNLSPSAHQPSPRWDKSFWQRPYTSAMAILSLQRNDIIECQKWLHRSVWWYFVNMIWNGKDTKQQIRTSTYMGLKCLRVNFCSFLPLSALLAKVWNKEFWESNLVLLRFAKLHYRCTNYLGECNTIRWHIEEWAARVMSPWSLQLKTGDGF